MIIHIILLTFYKLIILFQICFHVLTFFQKLSRETELRIIVNGDGKYLMLFYTGCFRKKSSKRKNEKKIILPFSFKSYFLRNSLTNHWEIRWCCSYPNFCIYSQIKAIMKGKKRIFMFLLN